MLHGENHDTATIRITERATGWLAVEKVDGISQRRRIPRRPVVDVDVVVPRRRDATRESLPPSLDYYLNFHLREKPRHLAALYMNDIVHSFPECLCADKSLYPG